MRERAGRRRLALALLLLPAWLPACDADPAPSPADEPRVVLLAVSGLDPDIVVSMTRAGELPVLRRLIGKGAFGPLQSIHPLLPPVNLTTVATGRNPPRHGVSEYLAADPETGRLLPTPSWLRLTEAVWDILGSHGMTVGVVNWPVTSPAEPVNGTMVPPERAGRPAADLDARYDAELARARRAHAEALRIWREERPRFLALRLGLLDPVCRDFMPFAPPRRPPVSEEDFERYRGRVLLAHRAVDAMIGAVADAAGPDATFLVISTHGMRHGAQRPIRPVVAGDRSEIRWRRPYGMILVAGRGVRPGAAIRGATVHDVMPTVLALLGCPRAKDLPGEYLADAFDLAAPTETVETYETDRPARNVARLFGEEAARDWNPLDLPPFSRPGRALAVTDPMVYGACLAEQGRYDKAVLEYEAAIRDRPGSAAARFQLGCCHQKMGRIAAAIESYRRAAWLDPGFTAAHIRLANLLAGAGHLPEALRIAARAVEIEPANAVARCHLGQLLLAAGRPDDGERQLRRALVLEPSFPLALNQLGIRLIARGRLAQAEERLRRAVELDPGFEKAWNNLGVTVLRRAAAAPDPAHRADALRRARETLDETVSRFPAYAKGWYNRARLHLLIERRDLALRDARRALELEPDYEEASRLVELLDDR